ncbi:hypothetical protein PSEEN3991 [Pseudomonas entomophila L48]|uniref:Uncharacterized protein n=2 Tax=Pseudomonas entomophila TaxID=312306 RepID=Q1I6P3_PSEE4|nr:hypothetical protein PSEEN3991 [Pseudomonas entomophila L48]
MFSENDLGVMGACMLDFNLCKSLERDSFIGVLLERLLNLEGIGTEMSGVFLGCDSDPRSIPDYLDADGFCMSFEYMDEYVVCSMRDGAKYIEEWCDKNVVFERESVVCLCKKLVGLYGGMTDLVRSDVPKSSLLDFYLCSSLHVDSHIGVLLECLLSFDGVGVGMSGVYLECDEDPDNIPVYLNPEGANMSFEFMEEYVVCSMSVGACYIRDWCGKNVRSEEIGSERSVVMAACDKLVELYKGYDDARVGV